MDDILQRVNFLELENDFDSAYLRVFTYLKKQAYNHDLIHPRRDEVIHAMTTIFFIKEGFKNETKT